MATSKPTNSNSLENMKDKSTWGGRRKGAGRKSGSRNRATLEKRMIIQQLEQRTMRAAHKLFNAELNAAIGETYLMVRKSSGTGSRRRTWVELVDDPDVVMAYLNDELENHQDEYYYISTKPADIGAIESILNRTFGRAKQSVALTGDDGGPVSAVVRFVDAGQPSTN